MRSLADGFFGKMLRYDKLPKLSSFFAVPVKAPEVTEGAFAFRDDHKAILYWKVRTKYPPFLAKKNPVIFVEVLAAPFSLSEE